MNDSTPHPAGRVLYWITTGVAATLFVIPGAANLARIPHIAHDMAHLGYPGYFMSILGTWKILAAIAILAPRFPRLKEWAYAGMIFDLTGAAISRAVVGDNALDVQRLSGSPPWLSLRGHLARRRGRSAANASPRRLRADRQHHRLMPDYRGCLPPLPGRTAGLANMLLIATAQVEKLIPWPASAETNAPAGSKIGPSRRNRPNRRPVAIDRLAWIPAGIDAAARGPHLAECDLTAPAAASGGAERSRRDRRG